MDPSTSNQQSSSLVVVFALPQRDEDPEIKGVWAIMGQSQCRWRLARL